MEKFQDLNVWARAKNLAVFVYKLTQTGKFPKDYGFRNQILREAVSIPSNISEGDELCTNKQAINFFSFARGSAAEVLTQAIIAKEIGYIKTEEFVHIDEECNAISSMLTKLIQARKK